MPEKQNINPKAQELSDQELLIQETSTPKSSVNKKQQPVKGKSVTNKGSYSSQHISYNIAYSTPLGTAIAIVIGLMVTALFYWLFNSAVVSHFDSWVKNTCISQNYMSNYWKSDWGTLSLDCDDSAALLRNKPITRKLRWSIPTEGANSFSFLVLINYEPINNSYRKISAQTCWQQDAKEEVCDKKTLTLLRRGYWLDKNSPFLPQFVSAPLPFDQLAKAFERFINEATIEIEDTSEIKFPSKDDAIPSLPDAAVELFTALTLPRNSEVEQDTPINLATKAQVARIINGSDNTGIIQWITLLMTFTVLTIIISRLIYDQRELRVLERHKVLSNQATEEGKVISLGEQIEIQREYILGEEPIAYVYAGRAHKTWQGTRSFSAVVETIGTMRDSLLEKVANSYEVPSTLKDQIPSIGFIGTILGLSRAIFSAYRMLQGSDFEKLQSFQQVTSILSTAFDTTLVALVAAFFVNIVLSFSVRQSNDKVVNIGTTVIETFNRAIAKGDETGDRIESRAEPKIAPTKPDSTPQPSQPLQSKMIHGAEVDIPSYTRYWVLPLVSVVVVGGLFFLYITVLQPSFPEFDGVRKGFGSSIRAFIPFLRH